VSEALSFFEQYLCADAYDRVTIIRGILHSLRFGDCGIHELEIADFFQWSWPPGDLHDVVKLAMAVEHGCVERFGISPDWVRDSRLIMEFAYFDGAHNDDWFVNATQVSLNHNYFLDAGFFEVI
jgi:hypothetical protein